MITYFNMVIDIFISFTFALSAIIISLHIHPIRCADSIFDFEVIDHDGDPVQLSKYSKSSVILVVNVASNCGFTYINYRELVELHDKYKSKGFEILAFPSNEFGERESGSNADIQTFVRNYGVSFPVFAKTEVNGKDANPLYKFLKARIGE